MNSDDDALIERIRPNFRRRMGASEKRMFGGICFMINGNMCVGSWKGCLIVRLDRKKIRTDAIGAARQAHGYHRQGDERLGPD